MKAGNCSVKRRKSQMDTGENKLNAEMMKKLYESYKLHQKEDYEKFVEDCKKIIYMSDRGCSDTEDILKMVKGELITDNHERRIHDHSGKQVLNVFFDEPYPVMMPEDEKMMRGMSNEIREKFQDYVESETGIPRETITIDSIPENVREKAEHDAILYGDSFVPICRAPRWVEQYLETQRWIDGIRDPEIVTLTGATKHFKLQQTCDQLKVLLDTLDSEAPDRNGRIWKREFMKKILNNQTFLTLPRGNKSWLWLKLLELQKSYEINLVRTLETPPSTKVDLESVIHMRWPKPDLSDLKAHDFRYGKMWQDQALINYATGDVSHIDTMILDSLAAFGPDINSGYGLSTPNLNDIDKKKLERVIKRRKKK
jgi:hypothetical protein